MTADLKRNAALAALEYVEPGMRLGIGSGSTAEAFVACLGQAVRDGLDVLGVPTSERTRELCEESGIPLSDLDETPHLGLTIDGADEIDAGLNLIKGGGGALLREKIVATASDRMIVIADGSKLVDKLGAFPLPIEVNIFGLEATRNAVVGLLREMALSEEVDLRGDEAPFETDGGHYILDARLGAVPDPHELSRRLLDIAGVVQHGLFLGIAERALIATPDGVKDLTRAEGVSSA